MFFNITSIIILLILTKVNFILSGKDDDGNKTAGRTFGLKVKNLRKLCISSSSMADFSDAHTAWNPEMKLKVLEDGFTFDTSLPVPKEHDEAGTIKLNPKVVKAFMKQPCTHELKNLLNDPLFPDETWLFPRFLRTQTNEHCVPFDMGIMHLWILSRNFGYNVRIMIMGHGMNRLHEDIIYDGLHSLYLTSNDSEYNEALLTTKLQALRKRTATKACIIGMQANNKKYGAGIAPKAILREIKYYRQIRGLSVEALLEALEYTKNNADVSEIDWTLPYILPIFSSDPDAIWDINKKFSELANEGRDSKGIIHVIETGPSPHGLSDYNCAGSALVNLIYTITVASVKEDGTFDGLWDPCSAIMVSAFGTIPKIREFYTSEPSRESMSFGFTTVGSGQVAAILALVIRLRPELTWRDVQYSIALSSQVYPVAHSNNNWRRNAAGFYVNEYFGFGVINAFFMLQVTMDENFETVPEMKTCSVDVLDIYRQKYPYSPLPEQILFDPKCDRSYSPINFIEHVQLEVSMTPRFSGSASINVASPSKTLSTLQNKRLNFGLGSENAEVIINNWLFDSVMFWGESPNGIWMISILHKMNLTSIQLRKLVLHIHGVVDKPKMYMDGPERRRIQTYFEPRPDV